MAHIVANLPPVKCFVRKEFLYDFEKGHGELVPCWWVSIKSLRGQAFRIEAYLNEYGALYDKLPLHAFCWKNVSDSRSLVSQLNNDLIIFFTRLYRQFLLVAFDVAQRICLTFAVVNRALQNVVFTSN